MHTYTPTACVPTFPPSPVLPFTFSSPRPAPFPLLRTDSDRSLTLSWRSCTTSSTTRQRCGSRRTTRWWKRCRHIRRSCNKACISSTLSKHSGRRRRVAFYNGWPRYYFAEQQIRRNIIHFRARAIPCVLARPLCDQSITVQNQMAYLPCVSLRHSATFLQTLRVSRGRR